MFGRRKSRKQEDMLVPHGLIWQATDEPQEPAESEASRRKSPDAAVNQMPPRSMAPPVVIPAQNSSSQPSRPAPPDASPARLGAISPPIPWPSPKTASVIRRGPPETIAPNDSHAFPARPQTPPAAVPRNVIQRVASPPLPALPSDAVRVGAQRDESTERVPVTAKPRKPEVIEAKNHEPGHAAVLLGSIRKQIHEVYGAATQSLTDTRHALGDTWKSVDLHGRSKALTRASMSRAASGFGSTKTTLQSWKAAGVLRVSRLASSVKTSSASALNTSITRLEGLARRMSNQRVRVRIVRSPWMLTLVQRGKIAWKARGESVRRDFRLWTSIVMAGLSALLLLGVISVVSHYAPDADASNKASSTSAGSKGLGASKIQKPTSAGASDQAPASAKAAAQSVKPKPAAHRARHSSNDDYVARDTYHYYGPNGKPQ